jgi:hypothetical protein
MIRHSRDHGYSGRRFSLIRLRYGTDRVKMHIRPALCRGVAWHSLSRRMTGSGTSATSELGELESSSGLMTDIHLPASHFAADPEQT